MLIKLKDFVNKKVKNEYNFDIKKYLSTKSIFILNIDCSILIDKYIIVIT